MRTSTEQRRIHITLLCPFCFGQKGLQRRLIEIRPDVGEGKCEYHPSRTGLPVEQVAAIVDEVFRNNYDFGDAEPIFSDDPEERGISYRAKGTPFRELLGELTEAVDERIIDAIADQLIEDDPYWPQDGEGPFYDDEMSYSRISHDDAVHGALWREFCEKVTYNERFFNSAAKDLLGEIFKNIHLQRDTQKNYPVYLMDPQKGAPPFYRGRVLDDTEIRGAIERPAEELGPPPRRAGKPNRMNPSGVSAVYAALDSDTCVSELRPLVGSKVVMAAFELRRPICVLDTTRFHAPPTELSFFAKDHARRLSQWRFMQSFMAEIAKPISPADEHLDYVPTQVVADYLNNLHAVFIGKTQRRIDAIIYNSAQRPGGKNIVLLGDAATVEPTARAVKKPLPSIGPAQSFAHLSPGLRRAPCLGVVENSLEILEVRAAQFTTVRTPAYNWNRSLSVLDSDF